MTIVLVLLLLLIYAPRDLARAGESPMQGELTLREAVAYALEHSPDLKTAVAEAAKRQGDVTEARSALLPDLSLGADVGHTRLEHGYPGGAPPSLLRFSSTTYSAGADVHVLVWDFQKTWFELAAARERLTAAKLLADRRKQELTFRVAQLYLEALTYQDLLEAARLAHTSLASLLERVNELLRAGRAVPLEAFKVQTQLALIESDSATLESGHTATLSSLAATMGFEGRLPRLAYAPVDEQAPAPPADPEQLEQEALRQRLDLKAAMSETVSAADLERSVKRSYLPRIDFRATATEYGGEDPVGFPTLIGRLLPGLPVPLMDTPRGVHDWALGLHISVPLFDSGRRRGLLKAAAAQAEQSRLAEQRLALNIVREVRTSYAELQSARRRVKAMQEAVVQAQEILRGEQAKYEAGRTVINFVLEAEAGLLNARSLLSRAQRSASVAQLALELGLGRLEADSLP